MPVDPTNWGPRSLAQPGGSVLVSFGSSIQTALDANPTGTAFWIEAGVRSLTSPLVPKSGQSLFFELGAILDGATWSSSDPTAAAIRAHNQDIDNVTIDNAEIRYMPVYGIRAFHDFSSGWTVNHVNVHHNKYGIELCDGISVTQSRFTYNIGNPNAPPGLEVERGGGYTCHSAVNMLMEDCEIAHNGPEQKVSITDGAIFRRLWCHHNYENGVWLDGDNTDFEVDDCLCEDNPSFGVFVEISMGGRVHHCILRRNQGAIFCSTSSDVEMDENDIIDNFRAIQMYLQYPAYLQGWDLANNYAHDNRISVPSTPGAWANGFSYSGDSPGSFLTPYMTGYPIGVAKNNLFNDNTYAFAVSGGKPFIWGQTLRTYTEWQALGQDAGGSFITSPELRQVKVFTGAPTIGAGEALTDDPILDNLGNSWAAGPGYSGAAGGVASWYIPSGSGDTIGGTLTFRGVTFDEPILAGAQCVAVAFYDTPSTELYFVLMEFGARVDTTPGDYSFDDDGELVTPTTSGQYAATSQAGSSGLGQVWIAAMSTDVASTATAPEDFREALSTSRHHLYYRVGDEPAPDGVAAFTLSDAALYQSFIQRFDTVEAPAYIVLPPATPTRPTPSVGDNSSTPDCSTGPGAPAVPEVVESPVWTRSCEVGGDVPTAADLVLVEQWDN